METPATPAQSGAKTTFDSASFHMATRSRTMAAVKVAAVGDFVQPEKLKQVAGSGGPAGAAAVTAYLQEEAQKAFYRKLEMIEGAGQESQS
eukprot:s376_g28.t1